MTDNNTTKPKKESLQEEKNISKKHNKPTMWELYLTKEIGIEFKACLYFFAMLFYYCVYRVCTGNWQAEIVVMIEMILMNYCMGYIQVYLLDNFDEAEQLGIKEILYMILCTALYTGLAVIGKWFQGNLPVIAGFGAYVLFMYVCVFFVYKERRAIDEKILNDDLKMFQTRNQKDKSAT